MNSNNLFAHNVKCLFFPRPPQHWSSNVAFCTILLLRATDVNLTFIFQWIVLTPHVLDMDSVRKVSVFVRKGGKEQTAARWIMMPCSVSQTVQVMAALI